MPVSLNDLLDAFQFVSFDAGLGENQAYLCRQSGQLYWYSEIAEEDELPDDVEDEEKYIPIPHKKELDLGKRLVFAFTRQFLPDDLDAVRNIFSRKGAYARFKDLLHRRSALKQWYDFESEAEKEALRDWCNLHSIELTD